MKEKDLNFLLEQSIAWNTDHNLTGMLLYIQGRFISQLEGRFMQILEGTEADVENLFVKIKKDSRHHKVIVLNRNKINQRAFSTWQMGFESVSYEKDMQPRGIFKLDESFLMSKDYGHANTAYNFLKSFYNINKDQNY